MKHILLVTAIATALHTEVKSNRKLKPAFRPSQLVPRTEYFSEKTLGPEIDTIPALKIHSNGNVEMPYYDEERQLESSPQNVSGWDQDGIFQKFSVDAISYRVNIVDHGAHIDSLDNRQAIQSAIDYANTNNYPVFIPNGTFHVSTLNNLNHGFEIPSHLHIFGESKKAIIQNDNNTTAHAFFVINGHDVTLSNFTINSNVANGASVINAVDGAHRMLIDHMSILGGGGWKVFARRCENIIIQNSIFQHEGEANCIELNECVAGRIVTNEIYGSTTPSAIASQSNAIEIYNLASTIAKGYHYIADNYIHHVNRGINLVCDKNSVVTGNRLLSVAEISIYPTYDDVTVTIPSSGIIISDNVIKRGGFAGNYPGIQLQGEYITVTGNLIDSISGSGILNYSPYTTISGNTITHTGAFNIGNQLGADHSVISSNVALNANIRSIYNEADYVGIIGNIAGDNRATILEDFAIFNAFGADSINISGNTPIGVTTANFSESVVSIYEVNARIGDRLQISTNNNIYKIEAETQIDGDGFRLQGSGIGAPNIFLDATNESPSNRYSAYINSWNGINSWGLGFRGNQNFSLHNFTNGSAALTILQSNNHIGIGTTNPARELHVEGSARITGSGGMATTITGRDAEDDITNVVVGAGLTLSSGQLTTIHNDILPETDNTYYIGKNDDDDPNAWKGIILKDQTTGAYYRLEINDGEITVTDLID